MMQKKRLHGMFMLCLEQQGRPRHMAKFLIDSKPEIVERVLSVQTSFVKMFDGVDNSVRKHFFTTNHLKRLIGAVVEEEMSKFPKSLG